MANSDFEELEEEVLDDKELDEEELDEEELEELLDDPPFLLPEACSSIISTRDFVWLSRLATVIIWFRKTSHCSGLPSNLATFIVKADFDHGQSFRLT
jgi:hypothetical protein